jgi:hypothetical protein
MATSLGRAFSVFGLLVGLAPCGCASAFGGGGANGPPAAALGPGARKDVATVCVVDDEMGVFGASFSLEDDGMPVGETQGKTYTCYLAEPGSHNLVAHSGRAGQNGEATLVAEAGHRYWFLESVFCNSGKHGACFDHLVPIDQARADELLDGLDYSGPDTPVLARASRESTTTASPGAT